MLAFGDSVTYGTLSSLDGRFLFDMPSHSYPARLVLGLNTYHAPQTFAVGNFGNPGEMVTQAVSRFQSVLTAERPQCVLLLEGVNDLNLGVPQDQISSAIAQMLDRAALTSTPVLLATMFRIYEAEGRPRLPARIVPFNDEMRRLAMGRLNVHIVDLYTAFGTDETLIGADGLHPTPEGYELMAATFLSAIERAFPVGGSVQ